MALRLGISSSMLPKFRGRLCLQRSFSPPALSRNRACVQCPSETVSSCQRCQPGGSPRPQASRASVSAAAGESYSNSLQCRSCDDADELGTSGRKHDDWLRSGGGLCSQGFADGRLQDVLRESDIHFAGTETPCHCQAENSSNYQRSFVSAVQSCSRLNCELSERSFQTRNDKAVQDALSQQDWLSLASSSFSGSWIGYPGYSMSSRSNLSCNCFCNHDMGWFCGASCWGIRKFPRHKSHVPSKASPISVAGWLSAAGHSSGAKSLRCAPKMSGSASSHLTSPTADHPSCESSKDLASAAGLLSLGSQEALLWGRGDYERPGDACTRQDEQQESELGSGSVKLAAKESQGFDESTRRQGRAFARTNEGSGPEENAKGTVRTGASQFVVGEEPVVAETQMEAAVMKALECSLGSPLGRESQLPPPKPLVIVISGPSGVGKDVVIKKLQEQRNSLHFVVTATTRPQRPGEVEGHDYFFVSKEKFQSMIDGGELLEHAVVYGDFKGIPKQQVRDCMAKGTDVVVRVDVQGAATVRSILGDNAVFIFLVAESEASLVKRLITRKTETLDKVVLRVATAREELKRLDEFDYAVVNADGQLDTTVSSICSIIDAEKSRVQQRTAVL